MLRLEISVSVGHTESVCTVRHAELHRSRFFSFTLLDLLPMPGHIFSVGGARRAIPFLLLLLSALRVLFRVLGIRVGISRRRLRLLRGVQIDAVLLQLQSCSPFRGGDLSKVREYIVFLSVELERKEYWDGTGGEEKRFL